MDGREDCFHLGAKALIHNDEGKLLLLQKSMRKSEHLWDLPGGRIHKNEALEDALKREVDEETGLKILQIVPLMMFLTNIRIPIQTGDVGLIFAVYLCSTLNNNSVQLSSEHSHFDWFEPTIAAELLSANHPSELTEKVAGLQLPMLKKP
jgi:8-oxo-dGTP pyrophosphatase MutT (NUDIX family)